MIPFKDILKSAKFWKFTGIGCFGLLLVAGVAAVIGLSAYQEAVQKKAQRKILGQWASKSIKKGGTRYKTERVYGLHIGQQTVQVVSKEASKNPISYQFRINSDGSYLLWLSGRDDLNVRLVKDELWVPHPAGTMILSRNSEKLKKFKAIQAEAWKSKKKAKPKKRQAGWNLADIIGKTPKELTKILGPIDGECWDEPMKGEPALGQCVYKNQGAELKIGFRPGFKKGKARRLVIYNVPTEIPATKAGLLHLGLERSKTKPAKVQRGDASVLEWFNEQGFYMIRFMNFAGKWDKMIIDMDKSSLNGPT